jgi:hypothetical protein
VIEAGPSSAAGSAVVHLGAWRRFWDEAQFSLRALAVARIIVSVVLIEFALASARPFALAAATAPYGFANVFHLPYASFIPALSYREMARLYEVVAGCGLLALVGVAVGPSLVTASALITLGLLQDRLAFFNHHHHLAVLALLLGCTPCAREWSLRAWLSHRRHAARGVAAGSAPASRARYTFSWAARLLQVTTSMVYLASAISKTKPAWWTGELLAAASLANADAGVRGLGGALDLVPPAWGATLALLAEYFLAAAWWHGRTRRWAFAVGAAFHLGVESGLMVGTFSWQVLAVYVIFAGERVRTPAVEMAERAA